MTEERIIAEGNTLVLDDINCHDADMAVSQNMLDDYSIEHNTIVYQGANTLTSNGKIPTNTEVIYKASQSITLTTGFHATAGTDQLMRVVGEVI